MVVGAQAGHYRLKQGLPKNPKGGQISYTNVTTVYTNTASGYGASAIDMDFVNCTGEIEAKFEWVPDNIPGTSTPDPLDVHPTGKVITAEHCDASYEASFYLPFGDAVGGASNDLGFELDEDVEPIYIYEEGQPVLIGYTVTGVAKGTRYTAVDGAEEITLTLNPFASVLVADGFCEAKVLYEARIIVPRVQLTGTTRFDTVDPSQIKFLTGQQIKAEVTFATPPGYIPEHLANPGIASRNWSVSAPNWAIFKNYIYGPIGQKVLLDGPDFTGLSFLFYSNNHGAIPGEVKCAVTLVNAGPGVRYVLPLPAIEVESRTVTSVKPTFKKWDVSTGLVQLYDAKIWFRSGPNSPQGQYWHNVEFEVPAPFEQVGQGCFVQLIKADRNLYRTAVNPGEPTHYVKAGSNNVWALDVGMPYTFPNNPYPPVWSLPQMGEGIDSPMQPTTWPTAYDDTWYRSTASDQFETWAMYRPPAVGTMLTTWIPMASYTWAWSGSAQKSLGTWSLLPGATLPLIGARNPSVIHPTWSIVSTSPFGFEIYTPP